MKIKKEKIKEGNYRLCWRYLVESRIYIFVMLAIFIIFTIIGFAFPVFFNDYIIEMIKKLAEQTKNLNSFQLFIFIFKNNLTASFMGLFIGIILGIYPIFLCVLNGYILGFVGNKTSVESGLSKLLLILPHGIFEIPAVIISFGLGLKLGFFIFSKNKIKQLKHNIKNSFRVFVYVIVPLLLIAGIIETLLIVFIR